MTAGRVYNLSRRQAPHEIGAAFVGHLAFPSESDIVRRGRMEAVLIWGAAGSERFPPKLLTPTTVALRLLADPAEIERLWSEAERRVNEHRLFAIDGFGSLVVAGAGRSISLPVDENSPRPTSRAVMDALGSKWPDVRSARGRRGDLDAADARKKIKAVRPIVHMALALNGELVARPQLSMDDILMDRDLAIRLVEMASKMRAGVASHTGIDEAEQIELAFCD